MSVVVCVCVCVCVLDVYVCVSEGVSQNSVLDIFLCNSPSFFETRSVTDFARLCVPGILLPFIFLALGINAVGDPNSGLCACAASIHSLSHLAAP